MSDAPLTNDRQSGCQCGKPKNHCDPCSTDSRTSDPVSTTKIVMKVGDTEKPTNPQQVKCADCNHVWVGFYLPQPISIAAKIMKNLCCPMCGAGAKRIMVHT